MDYSKQEKFEPLKGSREILKGKTVAIVGLGGLGSHLAEYMTRIGIGKLILIDDDYVEVSNLPRQTIYTYEDSLRSVSKAEACLKQLSLINPEIIFDVVSERLSSNNIAKHLEKADLVLDGTDNLRTRYLVNDYCFEKGIPWIYASATSSMGTVINFIPGKTPCFRCVFGEVEEDQASCDINGVILPALTMTTSIQVTDALKILLNKEPSLEEIRFNVWTREETSVPIHIFLDEECSCQTNQKKKPQTSLYMICAGDSIQVNTNYSVDEMEKRFKEWGYTIKQIDSKVVQTHTKDSERIVGFQTGKIVFHHVEKEKILSLL